MLIDRQQVRETLTRRRAELQARASRIEAELGQPIEDDFEEQALDREDDEPLDAIERSALGEIEAIDKALARLEEGVYGLCLSCGEKIDPKRLQAMPAAAECIACADAEAHRRH